jgi:phage repressor protein C with HTH and peptisase S24 domain
MNGEVVDRATMPPALEGVPGAYAIYAVGTSMEPRYYEGELLYIHPSRPAGAGDHVVVQLHPEHEGDPIRAMVKRLVRPWRVGSTVPLVLEQYNPRETFKVPAEQVKAIHKIMNGNDLFYG